VAEEREVPVIVDNDANAAAIGELLFGAARGVRECFYLVAHNGVGGALIVGGRLRRGFHRGAGEVGHITVDPKGPPCGCGRRGCLEAYAGRSAIARRAAERMSATGREAIHGRPVGAVDADTVIAAARQGDELAVGVLEEAGTYLGIGVASAINLLDPGLIVVGGSTIEAGELVLAPLRSVVRERVLPALAGRAAIVPGELGRDAAAVGAAALVLRELFAASLPGERFEPREATAVAERRARGA
jgi:glucokinase